MYWQRWGVLGSSVGTAPSCQGDVGGRVVRVEQELHISVGRAAMATIAARSFRPTISRYIIYVRKSGSQPSLEGVQVRGWVLDAGTVALLYSLRGHFRRR